MRKQDKLSTSSQLSLATSSAITTSSPLLHQQEQDEALARAIATSPSLLSQQKQDKALACAFATSPSLLSQQEQQYDEDEALARAIAASLDHQDSKVSTSKVSCVMCACTITCAGHSKRTI